MMASLSRSSFVTRVAAAALVALVAAASACADTTDALGDGSADLAQKASFTPRQWERQVELIGETFYGASTPAIPFNKRDKPYKAFSFLGAPGDEVSLKVTSVGEDRPLVYLVDDKFRAVPCAKSSSPSQTEARLDTTLPGKGKAQRTFYIVYRSAGRNEGAAFMTDLQGPCGDTTGLCSFEEVVDPNTCACVPLPPPPPAPTPVVVDPTLLARTWQMVAVSDSGNAPETFPDGPIYTFRSDGQLQLDCSGNVAGTWKLDDSKTIIEVTLGDGSVFLQWIALELDADHFTFYEGGDAFHFQPATCP